MTGLSIVRSFVEIARIMELPYVFNLYFSSMPWGAESIMQNMSESACWLTEWIEKWEKLISCADLSLLTKTNTSMEQNKNKKKLVAHQNEAIY